MPMPPIPVEMIVSRELSAYLDTVQRHIEHIEALHTNQANTLMQRDATIDELRRVNETQMHQIDTLLEEKANQRTSIKVLQSDADQHAATIAALRSDITIINEELDSEAQQRDWCSEYKDFCDRVNQRLTYGHLGPEVQTFHIEHTYEVTITGSVLVRDQREAEDAADRQYAGLREGAIFRMPDDIQDALVGDDRGELHHVRWRHINTNTTGNEEE